MVPRAAAASPPAPPSKVQTTLKGSRRSKTTSSTPFCGLPHPSHPPRNPHTRERGAWSPLPGLQKQRGATVISSSRGVSSAPGSFPSPAKPGLISLVRYFVHHPSRHLIQGPEMKEGKKKSLNATPTKPVFPFSLWLTALPQPRKKAPQAVVADSFLKEEGGGGVGGRKRKEKPPMPHSLQKSSCLHHLQP